MVLGCIYLTKRNARTSEFQKLFFQNGETHNTGFDNNAMDCSISDKSENKILHVENGYLSADPVMIPGNETGEVDLQILRDISGNHFTLNVTIHKGTLQLLCHEAGDVRIGSWFVSRILILYFFLPLLFYRFLSVADYLDLCLLCKLDREMTDTNSVSSRPNKPFGL